MFFTNNFVSWIKRNFYKSSVLNTDYMLFYSEKETYFNILKHIRCFSSYLYRVNVLDFSCWETSTTKLFYPYFYINLNDISFLLIFKIKSGVVLKTVSNFFLNTNWLEREVFDLYGIIFFGHRNMKKLLTEYNAKVQNPFLKANPILFDKK